MHSIAAPIANEREYVTWFVRNSSECALLRSFIVGGLDKFADTVARVCEEARKQLNTADKLSEYHSQLCVTYSQEMLPVINDHGGLEKLLDMPPKLVQQTMNALSQITVFSEIFLRKYPDHFKSDLVTMIKETERVRPASDKRPRGWWQRLID